MDIELTTGPLAHAAYKPYIFKFMSKSLRAVSMGIVEVEEGDNPIGLELVDAPRGTAQQAADMRDAALERANDFEAKLTDWTAKAQTAIDAVNQVAAAVGGKTQSSVTDAQDTAAGLATHVEGATTGRITAVVGAAQTAAVDVIMKSELGPVIASTASYLPLLGPAMSFSKAAVRLVRAIRATRAIPFVTARNTGVNVERAKVNARLGVFSSCRMLQMLQRQLEAQILLNIAATDDELEANFALLGLPAKLEERMPKAAKLAIGRSFSAALCAVLNPLHHRINAIFRGYAVCGGGAVAAPPYSTRDPAVAAILSPEMAPANAAVSTRHAFMPHVDTCDDGDLYDIILTSSAKDVAAWTALGYKQMTISVDADTPADLNGKMTEKSSKNPFSWGSAGSYAFKSSDKYPPRILLSLTCKKLKDAIKAPGTAPDVKAYLERIKLPITDLRIVSRARIARGGVPDVAGADEEVLIKSGMTPLLLAGAPVEAAKLAVKNKYVGYSATFPAPAKPEDPQTKWVVDADVRSGHGQRAGGALDHDTSRKAMFVYVARGGPTVVTSMVAIPFTWSAADVRARAWTATAVDASGRRGPAVLPAELTKALKAVDALTVYEAAAGSLVAISKEVTYASLQAETTYNVKDLGAPASCAVESTPAWAWFVCVRLRREEVARACGQPAPGAAA